MISLKNKEKDSQSWSLFWSWICSVHSTVFSSVLCETHSRYFPAYSDWTVATSKTSRKTLNVWHYFPLPCPPSLPLNSQSRFCPSNRLSLSFYAACHSLSGKSSFGFSQDQSGEPGPLCSCGTWGPLCHLGPAQHLTSKSRPLTHVPRVSCFCGLRAQAETTGYLYLKPHIPGVSSYVKGN